MRISEIDQKFKNCRSYEEMVHQFYSEIVSVIKNAEPMDIPNMKYLSDERLKERAAAVQSMRWAKEFDKAENDSTAHCMRLRKRAVLKTYKKAELMLKGIMSPPDIRINFLTTSVSISAGGYNSVDQRHIVTLAAAIWILDQLSLQGDLEELYPLLPDIEDERIDYIPLKHPSYSDELLQSMIYLMLHRNDGIRINDPKGCGRLLDELPAAAVQEKEKPEYRKNLDAVFKLLNKAAVKNATAAYEKKVWEFYRLAFTAEARRDEKRENMRFEIAKIEKEIHRLMMSKGERQAKTGMEEEGLSRIPFYTNQAEIDRLSGEKDKLEKCLATLEWRTSGLFSNLSNIANRDKQATALEDIIGKDISEKVIQFSVEDPYESAFALFYLLDSGSDLPWIWYGSIAVTYTFADQLPFYINPTWASGEKSLSTYIHSTYQHRYPGCRWLGSTDAFDDPQWRKYGKNLSQLLFENTLTLLPRVTREIPQIEEIIAASGIQEPDGQEVLRLLLHTLSAMTLPTDYLNLYHIEQSTPHPVEFDVSTVAELQTCIKQLKQENDKLRSALHEETASRRERDKELSERSREKEKMRMELSDLRELVFNQEGGTQAIDKNEKDGEVKLYPTKGKILSFGGFQSWLHTMKKLLPSVRFISPETQPNVDLIRNADVIWIQTNCLAHADFYRIVNTARAYDKTIRYFRWASPQKCAQQVQEYAAQGNGI